MEQGTRSRADYLYQGGSTGPALTGTLEDNLDSLWVQGVGGPYDAALGDNMLPKGTSQEAIDEAIRLFTLAHEKCPEASIVTGGYRYIIPPFFFPLKPKLSTNTPPPLFSQGTAVIAGSVSELEPAIQDQVKGAVLFGYTKNKQNNEQIPNFPTDRTSIFCNEGDQVCEGTLILAPPHFAYTGAASGPAAEFLLGQVA